MCADINQGGDDFDYILDEPKRGPMSLDGDDRLPVAPKFVQMSMFVDESTVNRCPLTLSHYGLENRMNRKLVKTHGVG